MKIKHNTPSTVYYENGVERTHCNEETYWEMAEDWGVAFRVTYHSGRDYVEIHTNPYGGMSAKLLPVLQEVLDLIGKIRDAKES